MAGVRRGYVVNPISPGAINAALAEVARFTQGRPDFGYFFQHVNRYRSDAEALAGLHGGGRLLELGSVPCHFTAVLQRLGYAPVGVDVAPERSGPLIEHFGLDVTRCDIEREPLPFPERHFRTVLCNEVFEHLRVDPLFVLSEINRVLADDGTLMLTTPNLYAIQQVARFATGRGFGDPVVEFTKLRAIGHMGHIREYSHREIRRFLAVSNFRVQKVSFHHYHYPRTWRGRLAKVLFRVLPARLRSFQVVIARKAGPSPGLTPLDRSPPPAPTAAIVD